MLLRALSADILDIQRDSSSADRLTGRLATRRPPLKGFSPASMLVCPLSAEISSLSVERTDLLECSWTTS